MTDQELLETIKLLLAQQSETMMQSVDLKLAQQSETIMQSVDLKLAQQSETMMQSVDLKLAQQKEEILAQTNHQMNVLLETKVQTQLNLLAEGQQAILEKLVPRVRVDELEDDVRTLQSVVRQVCEDVRELKQAQ